jgi:hypothetical protein
MTFTNQVTAELYEIARQLGAKVNDNNVPLDKHNRPFGFYATGDSILIFQDVGRLQTIPLATPNSIERFEEFVLQMIGKASS